MACDVSPVAMFYIGAPLSIITNDSSKVRLQVQGEASMKGGEAAVQPRGVVSHHHHHLHHNHGYHHCLCHHHLQHVYNLYNNNNLSLAPWSR